MMRRHVAPAGVMACLLLASAPVRAQQPPAPAESAELAKKLTNPVSDLVSVPFQLNWEQGVGPADQTRFILNLQPVMPFSINGDWNMIARVIIPFINMPPLGNGTEAASGIGDVQAQIFFSPAKSKVIWGVGPVISLPSTTEPTLGTEKWSMGPTAVVLEQRGPWTYGTLWNQAWSVAGNPSRADVSQMFLQPFLAYNTKSLWTFTLQSETTANWEAPDHKWTVPINAIAAKLSSFGPFPASYQIGVGAFVAHPETGPQWKLRVALVLLLPKRK